MIHFIGIRDNQWIHAVKVWGKPDFVHQFHDKRCHGDIDWDVDTIVFGDKGHLEPHPKYSWQDHELN